MAQPREQVACLRYLDWQERYKHEKPFQVFAEVPEGSTERLTNLVFVQSPPISIRDLRGNEEHFSLDQNGFMIRRYEMPNVQMTTQQQMKENVIPCFDALVKREVKGADFVYCFDWGVRHLQGSQTNLTEEQFRSNDSKAMEARDGRMNVNDKMHVLSPGAQVHCGRSYLKKSYIV